MTPISIAAWTAVLVGYVLLRMYATRRAISGHVRWLWVSQSLPIVTGLILVAVAVGFFRTLPWMSLLVGGFGVAWAAIAVIFVRRSIRAMAPATTAEQRVDALMQPTSDYVLAMMGAGLLAGLAMLAGVFILAIAGQL